MKLLGIIGGLGPMASAYFSELIVTMTDAKRDQEHLPTVTLNLPAVPDRTAFVLGQSKESPVPPLVRAAQVLERLGACLIAGPCVTPHCTKTSPPTAGPAPQRTPAAPPPERPRSRKRG